MPGGYGLILAAPRQAHEWASGSLDAAPMPVSAGDDQDYVVTKLYRLRLFRSLRHFLVLVLTPLRIPFVRE